MRNVVIPTNKIFEEMWQIYITGEEECLKRTIDLFSIDREGFEIKNKNNQFYIETFIETEDVNIIREEGKKFVSRINGALKLFLDIKANIQLVGSKAVKKIGKDGDSAAVFVSFTEELKVSGSINVTIGDGKGNITRHPQDDISNFINAGNSNDTIHKVLKLTSNLESWVNLYRIYEVIEEDMEGIKNITNLEWGSGKKFENFRRTACSPKAIGLKARHGRQKGDPPTNPMLLNEAKDLIKGLIINWINYRK